MNFRTSVFLLFTFLCFLSAQAQDKELKEFGKEVFQIMQEERYDLFPGLLMSDNAVPLLKEFQEANDQKKAEGIRHQQIKVITNLIEAHEELFKRAVDWKKTSLQNVYAAPVQRNTDFKLILLEFKDTTSKTFLAELTVLQTTGGYRLADRGIRLFNFRPETDSLIKEHNLKNQLPDRYDDFLFHFTLDQIDTVVSEVGKGFSITIYKGTSKAEEIIEDKENNTVTANSYFPNGTIMHSMYKDKKNKRSVEKFYTVLGKLSSEHFSAGDTTRFKWYHINGLPKSEGTLVNNQKQGRHIKYFYTGQERENSYYVDDQLQGIYRSYNILGELSAEKNYSIADTIASVEELKYFVSYDQAFDYFTERYQTLGILHRRPSGWYVSKIGEAEEYQFWSYKKQSFVYVSAFPERGYNDYKIKGSVIKDLYKPQTLFSAYDDWSKDVINLLKSEPAIPDSLKMSLFLAYCDQISQHLLKGNITGAEEDYEYLKRMNPDTFTEETGLKLDHVNNQYTWLALVAKSVNNSEFYKRFLSMINFPDKVSAHGKRVFEECSEGAYLFTTNGLLMEGLQLSENIRPDVKVIDIHMLTKDWYRNYVRQQYGIEFTIQEDQYGMLPLFVTRTRHGNYGRSKHQLLSDFLGDIQNVTDGLKEVNENNKLKEFVIPVSEDAFYALRTPDIFDKGSILILDVLDYCVSKHPDAPVAFDNGYLSSDYILQGMLVTQLAPVDSSSNKKDIRFLNDPSDIAFKIKKIEELDADYSSYYSVKYADLTIRYFQAGQKPVARKLLKQYLKMFGSLNPDVFITQRIDLIKAAYSLGEEKLGDEYMYSTQRALEVDSDPYSHGKSRLRQEMLPFFKYNSMEEKIKKYYPEDYKEKSDSKPSGGSEEGGVVPEVPAGH